MPQCLKCGAELPVNEEGMAPVLCDRCAGHATSRARRGLSTGTMRDYPVTSTLIAICLAAYVGKFIPGLNVDYWGANIGILTVSGQYWRLVTAGFLHAGIFHIGFNMWCLWSLGRLAERLFGRWQTLALYLLTGVGGALLSIAHDVHRNEVGASGAIFGIAGALLAGLKFGNLAIGEGERRSLISSTIFFVVVNFALGAGLFGFGGNIDNLCHLGGFITGLLMGLPMGAFKEHHKALQWGTLVVTAALLAFAGQELVQAHESDTLPSRVNQALGKGDYSTAIPLLEQYTATNPDDDGGWVVLGDAYSKTQRSDKAIAAYQQALKVNPNSTEAKEALAELQGTVPAQK